MGWSTFSRTSLRTRSCARTMRTGLLTKALWARRGLVSSAPARHSRVSARRLRPVSLQRGDWSAWWSPRPRCLQQNRFASRPRFELTRGHSLTRTTRTCLSRWRGGNRWPSLRPLPPNRNLWHHRRCSNLLPPSRNLWLLRRHRRCSNLLSPSRNLWLPRPNRHRSPWLPLRNLWPLLRNLWLPRRNLWRRPRPINRALNYNKPSRLCATSFAGG